MSEYTKYIPEYNYPARKFIPFKVAPSDDMCGRCEAYYKDLYDRGITSIPFPPTCEKHIRDRQQWIRREDFDSDTDYADSQILLDPVVWAYAEFGWSARWFQEEMLSCTSQKKLYRCGRRIGKTEAMIIECLHHITTHNNNTVLIIAPYERQVTRFYDEMDKFIKKSSTIRGSVARYTRAPSRLEFKNGSKVLGFSAGSNSGSGSDKIRGQDAHMIIIDEIDTIEDADIDAVMAILASHPNCKLIAATTPRGWRKRFYTYITQKDLGFKEFWFISAESPVWDDKAEKFYRASNDATTFSHEYLADFAELEEGVFKRKFLDASIQDYDISDVKPTPTFDYVLGVDWNKSAGTHMVIVEVAGGKFKLVKKIVIPESEYMQTDSVESIVVLNRIWRFKHIFLDAGYGSVQTEMLKKQGLREPSSNLVNIVHAIHMNQHLDVLDPVTGEKVKKFAKPFIVEQTRRLLEDGYLLLPRVEDTSASNKDVQMGLIQQMRNFRVESHSIYGLPRYSQGQEHTLTAYMLACAGYVLEEGDLKKINYNNSIASYEVSDENPAQSPAIREREEDKKNGWQLIHTTNKKIDKKTVGSRDLDVGRPIRRTRNLNSLNPNLRTRSNSSLPRNGRDAGPYRRGSF